MNEPAEDRLYVLGVLRLERRGSEVKFPRRKAASLLAYLALHPQKHGRDHLATLLWGDYVDDEARASLRNALSLLRRMVGDDAFIADAQTVQINPTFPLWVDARAFEGYAREFLAAPSFDLSPSFIDLYQGDLLPDLYDDWIGPERDRLRSLYIDALLQAVQQMRSRSEYAQAIELAQRVLAIEPSNERAHQHLMFCYVATGDRSAALRQYEACRQALHDDLAVEPLPETTALANWMKGKPEHEQAREARITNLPIPLTSFIGREQEMTAIKRLLAEHRLVTVTGTGRQRQDAPGYPGRGRPAGSVQGRCVVRRPGRRRQWDPRPQHHCACDRGVTARRRVRRRTALWPFCALARLCWCSTTASMWSLPAPIWPTPS